MKKSIISASRYFIIISVLILLQGCNTAQEGMQKLVVSENGRFLVKEDGSPFVWVGETNWFFAQLPPETIDKILDKRKEQGFTIMFISCRQELYKGGSTGPTDQPNEEWWAYLDEYIDKCAERGMYVGITLGWWGKAMNSSPEKMYEYGLWAGRRYADRDNIVWLTLGEAGGHSRRKTIPDENLEALVKGIREGDTGNKLLTVHADYRRGTSLDNDTELCDFNNWQTSQWCCRMDLPRNDDREWTVWEAIQFDYEQLYNGKPKPTLDSEAWYENNKDFCGATPHQIRRRAWFTILAGAFGHTYGAGGMWDGLTERDSCSGTALESLDYPGAEDMGNLSCFLHSLGDRLTDLVPDQAMITNGNSSDYDLHIQAARDRNGEFAIIYSASDSDYRLDLKELNLKKFTALWYKPGDNTIRPYSGKLPGKGTDIIQVDPPGEEGPGNDWVLILGSPGFIKKFRSSVLNCTFG